MKNYGEEILQMVDICKVFDLGDGKKLHAAENVNVTIHKGETVGIVGESGSGKSTLAKMLTRLYSMTSGKIIFHGKDITDLKGEALRQHRKSIQMVFQDPSTAFNPKQRVKEIICEPLENFGMIDKKDVEAKAKEMLRLVDLPEDFADRYPNNMSGGQRQRIGIARAIVLEPDLIIADEPISALDVSIQAQVINLLNDLRNKMGLTIMFIAHNLSVVKYFSDRIGVMYYGKLVELADSDELFEHPLHPYTKSLLSAIPYPDPHHEKHRQRIEYKPLKEHDYSVNKPSLREIKPGHFINCNDEEFERYKKELGL